VTGLLELAEIGDLIRRGVSDGDRLCAWGEYIPADGALYWPTNPESQYDDSDPHCFDHAVDRAEDRGHIAHTEAAALRARATNSESSPT
jgi:hypothetical protein